MKICFALPSHTYNIVLSKEEVTELVLLGHVSLRPQRIDAIFKGECGNSKTHGYHHLICGNHKENYNVQFLNIVLDREEKLNENP